MSHRIAAFVTVALLCLGAAREARAQSADLVAFNGKVFTARDGAPMAQAFAVKDGRFVLVGPTYNIRAHIGADTKVIDLGGRFVVPGLGDAHFHNEGGGAGIDLSATPPSTRSLMPPIRTQSSPSSCLSGDLAMISRMRAGSRTPEPGR